MTGPEHYCEAERLLSDASFSTTANGLPCTRDGHLLSLEEIVAMRAAAQVHATLALAAATAMAAHGHPAGMHVVDFEAWDDVCGVEGQ